MSSFSFSFNNAVVIFSGMLRNETKPLLNETIRCDLSEDSTIDTISDGVWISIEWKKDSL